MQNGYIKLWRKFTETSFYKHPKIAHLAVYLLLDCNHKPKKFIFNGKEELCDRGQTITGLVKMSQDTGISIRSLRTGLHVLSNTGFLTSKTTNRFRIISICKYNEYQYKTTSITTIKRQSNDNQTTTNKNDKNDKNDKNKNPPTPLQVESPKAHKETAEQYIVRQYKISLGVPELDKEWDKRRFGYCVKFASGIIAAFDGDKKYACDWVDRELVGWREWAAKTGGKISLQTMEKNAWDQKGKYLEEKARIDKLNRREENDKSHFAAEMVFGNTTGQSENSGFTQIGKAATTIINKEGKS